MALLFIGLMTILAGHESPAPTAGAEHYRDDRPPASRVGTHVPHHEHHDSTSADATGEFVASSNVTLRITAGTQKDYYDDIYEPEAVHQNIASRVRDYKKPAMREHHQGHLQAPCGKDRGEMARDPQGQASTADPVPNDVTSLSQYSLATGAKWSSALTITYPAMAFEEMMPGKSLPGTGT